ncbi:hypothetical protein KM043_013041 [Ampulex compressa]|nr:hypothetical protein KM043_013041 [Ampulex compressa]
MQHNLDTRGVIVFCEGKRKRARKEVPGKRMEASLPAPLPLSCRLCGTSCASQTRIIPLPARCAPDFRTDKWMLQPGPLLLFPLPCEGKSRAKANSCVKLKPSSKNESEITFAAPGAA